VADRPSRSLADYRRKRAAGATPEPFGRGQPRPRAFVVQEHAARRRHHDFRLEWGGVLLSWAVPRGPSLDPAVKRLAVRVEDHPVDYADFEGVIPEGNYGAGAVIVWDRGRWLPVEDVEEGLARGKLLFDLEGHKLRGRFTLVRTGGRTRPESREWLLIKKADAFAVRGAEADSRALPPESVLSGLSLDELREGPRRAERVRRRLARQRTPRGPVEAARVQPMLAEPCARPFSRPGWLFEVKYDGYRAIAEVAERRARIFSRRGRELTRSFPELATTLAALPFHRLVLDGEIVAADAAGRPDFQRLQQRAQLRRAHEIGRASVEWPATYWVFDLLAFEDFDLRGLPLRRRRELLEQIVPRRGPVRLSPAFAEQGEAVYREATARGFEGMVAKRAASPYRSRRSGDWLKLRRLRSDDFVILGYAPGRGSRSGLGSLHLGAFAGGELLYAGRVGSGLDAEDRARLAADLDGLARPDPPCPVPRALSRGSRWAEPRLVCEVRYAEVTADGCLRQPVFVRRRDDKAPRECSHPGRPPAPAPAAPAGEETAPAREVPFTNLEKVFWPDDRLTKGDLVDYYRAISPWLLPYLGDRPLVLTRYPDGIEGKSFFQKDAPAWAPSWVRTETLWSEGSQREIRYFVCDELEQLLYVVNLGTIPLHVWSSRVATLAYPDWCILDLDPKEAPFAHVVRLARALLRLCRELGLPARAKTSGSTGLHVLVALGRRLDYERSRTLAGLLARAVERELPEITTLARRRDRRGGRVYVDTGQNGHGRLLAAPFSVRPLPGAPVSMPLRDSELSPRLQPRGHTLRDAPARMRRLRHDPLRAVLDATPDLLGALSRLEARLAEGDRRRGGAQT
jgi:bifunctional non-homologous end joining protein LigD